MSTQSAGARVNALSYLPKWLILAAVIGAIAGVSAVSDQGV
jgi:hypothetical protein